ncbi:hypothetical protein [Tuberibacillus sp. Marseille-P3662]|uniref:hypothetical protein n=1 Tax=Tuberibacillus sp. Marseille-P3662 TaxID=1965358 RepID=UPI00159390E6|nr:hypothetical protein [Tuberibacillus sp. Marseille-P3662]
MSDEKEEVHAILKEMPKENTQILREVLEAEKSLLHRETLQGTNIISQIVDIVKERVGE